MTRPLPGTTPCAPTNREERDPCFRPPTRPFLHGHDANDSVVSIVSVSTGQEGFSIPNRAPCLRISRGCRPARPCEPSPAKRRVSSGAAGRQLSSQLTPRIRRTPEFAYWWVIAPSRDPVTFTVGADRVPKLRDDPGATSKEFVVVVHAACPGPSRSRGAAWHARGRGLGQAVDRLQPPGQLARVLPQTQGCTEGGNSRPVVAWDGVNCPHSVPNRRAAAGVTARGGDRCEHLGPRWPAERQRSPGDHTTS